MTLHWVDYAIILVLALSVLTGLIRGFVKELVALCVWMAAIWVAYTYSSEISPWFQSYFHDASLRIAASFIVLLLVTLLVGSLVSSTLSFLLNHSPLKGSDRLLGMGFGLARGMFIVALLIGIINLTSLAKDTEFKTSLLYTRFKPLSEWLFSFMPDGIKQIKQLDNLEAKEKKELNTIEPVEHP
ncbi:MAG: CvpA family protein [Legionella sp.]|nr:CvpA family protein [Legionella sp.]